MILLMMHRSLYKKLRMQKVFVPKLSKASRKLKAENCLAWLQPWREYREVGHGVRSTSTHRLGFPWCITYGRAEKNAAGKLR